MGMADYFAMWFKDFGGKKRFMISKTWKFSWTGFDATKDNKKEIREDKKKKD